ncbi:MAG: peptidyl-prolyl cis-trans isomerase [Aquincola sp.]|nr:peptidyl-prolyl cis-trans isomerase [Aquincola sp.]MDH5329859.1 peptidyl-prolyl cis-trans isomerase [Aquincola sp.]
MRAPLVVLRLLLVAWLAVACAGAAAQATVARVNGVAITLEQLDREFDAILRSRGLNIARMQRPDQARDLRREALDALIRDELLWQKAQREGAVASDLEVDRAIAKAVEQARSREAFDRSIARAGFDEDSYRRYVRRMLSADRAAQDLVQAKVRVTDAEIEQFYRDNAPRFVRPEQLRVREILLRVAAPGGPAQREQARQRLAEIRARVLAGEDFAELARRHSDHPTRQWGGAHDPVVRGQLAAPLEEAAVRMQPGETSEVIETAAGVHLLRLDERLPAATIALEQARDPIREHLTERHGREVLDAEVATLRRLGAVDILVPM